MAFDGIVTKAISQELQNLSGARIDKVYQPKWKNTFNNTCKTKPKNRTKFLHAS